MARIFWAIVIFCSMGNTSWAQSVAPKIQATGIQLVNSVVGDVLIDAPNRSVVIPFCGEGESGRQSLCSLSSHFEVQTPTGWISAKLRYKDVVLGGMTSKQWKLQTIPSGERQAFSFAFSKNVYAIDRGQKVRIVVDAWLDEASAREGKNPIQLITPPFDCP